MCSEIFSDMSHVLFYILYALDILETVSYIDLGKDKGTNLNFCQGYQKFLGESCRWLSPPLKQGSPNGFPNLTWSKIRCDWTSWVWYAQVLLSIIERPASFWYYIVPLRDLVFMLVIDKIYSITISSQFTHLSYNWLRYHNEVTWPVTATTMNRH